ncbi:NAD-dependent epimerase/dehydratase family protein [Nocardia sp. NPDC003482]
MDTIRHTVITGGAGLIGSHLALRLLDQGHEVTVIDNLCTGYRANLDAAIGHRRFGLRIADAADHTAYRDPATGDITDIVHLAGLEGPATRSRLPIATLETGSAATKTALEVAAAYNARIVVASSGAIYNETATHPRDETSTVAIDPVGPHSAYQVAKLYTEAAANAYVRSEGVRAGVVRLGEVYGPHMRAEGDRSMVAAFCAAALEGRTLTVTGGDRQMGLLYVSDAVDALYRMLEGEAFGPVNIAAAPTGQVSVTTIAEMVITLVGAGDIEHTEGPVTAAPSPCLDISRAATLLGWKPQIPLATGLEVTLEWMRAHRAGPEIATGQGAR